MNTTITTPGGRAYSLPEIIARADQVFGWMTPNELRVLATTAISFPRPVRWVEIGSYKGRSATAVAMSLPPGSELHLVDPMGDDCPGYPARECYHKWVDQWPTDLLDAIETMRSLRPDIQVRHHRTTSVEAARAFEGRSLDAVFIDGDHSYEFVCQDCRSWEPKLRTGGLLMGHDYNVKWPDHTGVNRAVDDLFGARVEVIGSTAIWCVEAR
jgi:predicted O-methyltransferase YrrM